jgi:hypothetical protein
MYQAPSPPPAPQALPAEVQSAINDVALSEMTGKLWWKSKTFWINLIAFGAALLQMKTGYYIDPSLQMMALALVNKWLRAISKEEILWS